MATTDRPATTRTANSRSFLNWVSSVCWHGVRLDSQRVIMKRLLLIISVCGLVTTGCRPPAEPFVPQADAKQTAPDLPAEKP